MAALSKKKEEKHLSYEFDVFASRGAAAQVFPNLGGDATLIAPTPSRTPGVAYGSLADLLREKDDGGRMDELWRLVGEELSLL